jgi:hypothetical protein
MEDVTMKATLIITLLLWSTSLILKGQIIHVPGEYSSIQDAIVASVDGDTVLVNTGTYYENINFLGKAITVASNYLIEPDSMYIYNTIIDGSQPGPNDSACVVLFNSGEDTTSVLYGFTITGGTGCYWPYLPIFTKLKAGGGVQIINCGAKICHNIITDNHVINEWEAFGGGIHGADIPEDKMIIVEDNLVYNNSATGKIWVKGGGIAVAFCHARICNNIVRNNSATGDSITVEIASGGIWYSNSTSYTTNVNISGNTITNNEVISTNPVSNLTWGGGMIVMALWDNIIAKVNHNVIANNIIYSPEQSTGNGLLVNQCDSIELTGNVIYGNSSSAQTSYGGGIGIWDSNPMISKNLVYNNTATRGGGIFIGHDSSQAQIINNTIYGNDATTGGGIYLNSSLSDIRNTIIWGNTANLSPGIYQAASVNNTVNYSDVQEGWTGTGIENINEDPLFFDAESGDFHLTENSPCIDAGDPSFPPDPDGSICDMGVFYYDSLWTEIQDTRVDIHSTICYPNPFINTTTIQFDLEKPGNVSITIFNHIGQQIDKIFNGELITGNQQFIWNASSHPDGIYFLHIRIGNSIETRKIIKLS